MLQAVIIKFSLRDESLHYPGVELVLHYKQFLNFDLLLQFIIFFVFLIFVITFSILLRQWKLLRRMTEIVPESVTLLVVGSLLGFIGHLISQHVYQYIPRLHTFEIDHLTVYSILIPPIILHASYDLYHPQFFRKLMSNIILCDELYNFVFNSLLFDSSPTDKFPQSSPWQSSVRC